jgi:hypothetical protein
VTVRTGSAGIATLSTDPSIAGSDTVVFENVTTTSVGTVYVHGRGLGSTSLVAEAGGYATSTNTAVVDPSGFVTFTGDFGTSVGGQNANISVFPVRLDPSTLHYAATQAIRGGLSVQVPVTSSNPGIGTATEPTLSAGQFSAISSFTPLSPGVTTITIGVPPGFDTPGTFRQITATVGQ